MVLGVVVAVGRRDVEHHAPEGLGARVGSQAQPIDDVEELRVVVRADLSKVELAQRAERLTMDLPAPGRSVVATGHEMGPSALLEEPTFHHLYAGRPGHQVVGVLNAPVATGRPETEIITDAVQLDYPLFKTGIRRDLTGADLVGGRVDGHHGLRPGASGRGSDGDQVAESLGDPRLAVELTSHRGACGGDQLGELNGGGLDRSRSPRGAELECADPSLAEVGQAVQRARYRSAARLGSSTPFRPTHFRRRREARRPTGRGGGRRCRRAASGRRRAGRGRGMVVGARSTGESIHSGEYSKT